MPSIHRTPTAAGIGLRLPHIEEAVATQPSVGWLEIHPENFLANPHATELLVALAERYPISVHTVGLSDAVVRGNSASIGLLLVGGQNASRRLAIHLRHYEASLTAAVVGRFPATGWLIGPHRLEAAARQFVHHCSPTALCIAEYGSEFPGFLATWPETSHLTYVPEFADLDWHPRRLAISIDVGAVGREHWQRSIRVMSPIWVSRSRPASTICRPAGRSTSWSRCI